MSGCRRCVTITGTTREEIWLEVRNAIGPTPVIVDGGSLSQASWDLMQEDFAGHDEWESINGPAPFGEWLLWRANVGTIRYGNLPEDKKHKGKVGHAYAPCPYSTQSNDLRTRHLLGITPEEVLPLKVDHTSGDKIYYMKTASRGSKWGFECTYPSCPYNVLNGQKYFFT